MTLKLTENFFYFLKKISVWYLKKIILFQTNKIRKHLESLKKNDWLKLKKKFKKIAHFWGGHLVEVEFLNKNKN